ncbi:DNA polymerase III subunit gamma/tau [Cognatilysobacter bugurensis]|uniref:DNA polymerase III subunit gamma/tau n=1 Tax=Cognatilysobacter bugurensis TaxID=543356 RepID=A0A918SUL2_9GAMM|nr:DNA polymerase III subunit gamma/tau [Lysobacter bugurensis]GHA69699.1 DNA polymerase III subunit gamma/tau [Lysobacter bugurensis]
MSYLVLARKWRPKRFAELVGQEHVVRALTNALDTGRVHHAFLFTGTRGVGKTTIARIFAKSLNCEQGTSADPCGECNSCKDIDAGRFLDLLEIDAASNTGVDDVREVIENAQYMPSRGRTKVYLIDEVHMLSKAAFNALLKTLEEPPGHVKFLLATTDPQKLPVTVLSRCLQFNLKRLDEAQIGGQMTRILEAEAIATEPGAIRQLAKAADGSLRDGLSLLDQAIAYTGGRLEDASVAAMLGSVDRTRVGAVLGALAAADGAGLMAEIAELAEFSPDWSSVLDAIADALHRVQVRQLVPDAAVEADGVDVDALAEAVRPELVQLWYQMSLGGRRDLPYAPSPRAGFEMTLLRMLAFRPSDGEAGSAPGPRDAGATRAPASGRTPPAAAPARSGPRENPFEPRAAAAALLRDETGPAMSAAVGVPAAVARERPVPVDTAHDAPWAPAPQTTAPKAEVRPAAPPAAARSAPRETATVATPSRDARLADAADWHALVAGSELRGPARLLAEHAGFVSYEGGVLRLSLAPDDEHLQGPVLVRLVAEALAPSLGTAPDIRFETAELVGESVSERNRRVRDERQTAAEHAFTNDADVQRLIQQRGARLVPDSIRPFDE